MKEDVFVSIIIPVYNGANYLKEAIDSAINQTYKNIEIIVVKDGSTDNTEKIALSYGDRIRYFKKENGGVSSALNLGIREMKGEYFSWLSHDDIYTPYKLENQIKSLSSCGFKKDVVSLCNMGFIDKNSNIIKKHTKRRFKDGKLYKGTKILHNLVSKGTFGGCQLLINKSILLDNGLFDENLRYAQDVLMWIKIFCAKNRLIFNSDIDVYNRIHENQLTQKGRDLLKKESLEIAKIILPLIKSVSGCKYNLVYDYAKRNAVLNNIETVRYCINNTNSFSLSQKFILKCIGIYGNIRPTIRRMYYKLFKKVKTQ